MERRSVDPCRVADMVVARVCWISYTARKRGETNWERRTQAVTSISHSTQYYLTTSLAQDRRGFLT